MQNQSSEQDLARDFVSCEIQRYTKIWSKTALVCAREGETAVEHRNPITKNQIKIICTTEN